MLCTVVREFSNENFIMHRPMARKFYFIKCFGLCSRKIDFLICPAAQWSNSQRSTREKKTGMSYASTLWHGIPTAFSLFCPPPMGVIISRGALCHVCSFSKHWSKFVISNFGIFWPLHTDIEGWQNLLGHFLILN